MNWTEESPTLNEFAWIYGQHDGARDTTHSFRWVYGDNTPVDGELGQWRICTDCTDGSMDDFGSESDDISLTKLHQIIVKAGDDRLDGRITREEHATIVRWVIDQLALIGHTFDDLTTLDGAAR